jgi:hypothetical protein
MLMTRLSDMDCLLSHVKVVTRRCHKRLGHLNFKAMKKMFREALVRGCPSVDQAPVRGMPRREAEVNYVSGTSSVLGREGTRACTWRPLQKNHATDSSW